MFFTICIPTFNRKDTLSRTLDSIIKQSFNDYEILVIDDGSTDKTNELIEKYKLNFPGIDLKYFYKENGGKHTALNKGIDFAKGEFFLILDSDDQLEDDALSNMHQLCLKIKDNDEYSGIMGKTKDTDNNIIGSLFPSELFISSYIDFHFFSGIKHSSFGDCCECNKTSILKKYRYPEDNNTKFVPEAYIFDQIGTQYKLLCTNSIFRIIEYREDGITLDSMFKKRNIVGYLYNYICRIENIFPKINNLPLRLKIIAWWRYWDAVKIDYDNKGPRVSKVTIFGRLIYFLKPLIDIYFKIRYKQIYLSGR